MPDIFVAENKTKKTKSQKPPANPQKEKNINPNHLKRFVNLFRLNSSHQDTDTNRLRMFTTFRENPHGINFEEKEEDEKVLLFLRRHFITNLSWISLSLIFVITPPVVDYLIQKSGSPNILIDLPLRYITVFLTFYYSVVFSFIFVNFITWFFNISLITDRRVVDIDFSGLVYKDVAATKLTLIQDVSYSQTGVIRSVFNYGDVLVQTAGSLENFDLKAVPHPERVVLIVEELIGKETHGIF